MYYVYCRCEKGDSNTADLCIHVLIIIIIIIEVWSEASVTAGSAAFAAEEHTHRSNDAKCAELGWMSIPHAVEMYG